MPGATLEYPGSFNAPLLSLLALFVSGLFDGVSMVIRRSLLRLLSPDPLRGRIAAANWIFICASNELGAFESGMLAAWIGTHTAREALATALTGMMRDGEISRERAEEIATMVMRGNAAKLYGLKLN